MTSLDTSQYRYEIDGLRAIAVMLVVLYHLNVPFFSSGFVGVDVFFVVSGFLITRLLVAELQASGTIHFSRFYLRRARRLFPALFATVAATYAAAAFLFWPNEFSAVSGSAFYSLLSLSNFYFWSQSGYFDASAYSKPLLHTWSLSVEEQFYLFWPLFLLYTYRAQISRLIIAATIIGVLSLALNYAVFLPEAESASSFPYPMSLLFGQAHSSVFFLLPFRVFEFAIGAVCMAAPARAISKSLRTIVQVIGLLMLIASLCLISDQMLFPGAAALLPCCGTALVIASGPDTHLTSAFRLYTVVFVAKISYSLYLVHWPFVVFYHSIVLRNLLWFEVVLLLISMIFSSALLFRYVETRFRSSKELDNSIEKDQLFGLGAALIVLFSMVPVVSSWNSEGWSWRFPKHDVAQFDFAKLQQDTVSYAEDNLGGGWAEASAKRVLVIGDSHGRDVANGLHQTLPQAGYQISWLHLTATCLDEQTPLEARDSCSPAWARLRSSAQLSSADIVVLSFRWRGETVVGQLDQFLSEIEKLASPSASILLLGRAPDLNGFPEIARRMLTEGRKPESINQRYSALTYWRRLDSNMAAAVAGRPRVIFQSKIDLICPRGECTFVFPDSRFLMWDESHWTLLGAKHYSSRLIGIRSGLFKT